MKSDLRHGDAFQVLAAMPAESVDSVVTDGPYGIAFMGKGWDNFAPDSLHARSAAGLQAVVNPLVAGAPSMHAGQYDLSHSANQKFQAWTTGWAREALRVLKPGGHLLSFCSTRTSHCAAVRVGARFIGIELEADYMQIAKARIAYHSQPIDSDGGVRPERFSLAHFMDGAS